MIRSIFNKSTFRFVVFLILLFALITLGNFWLVNTDSVTAKTVLEMQARNDIELAVVGSSVVRDHFNQQLISEETGKKSFSVTVPGSGFQTFLAVTEEMYKTSSPEWVVLVVEPYNFNTAREDPQPYYKLFPWLTGLATRYDYYLQTAKQDGYWLDRAVIMRDFPARTLKELRKTIGMRLSPDSTFRSLVDEIKEDDAEYMGLGFLRHESDADMTDTIRQEMLAEKDLGYAYSLLPDSKQMLLQMRDLVLSHGSRFSVVISDNHTSHALAEPEYLRYMQNLMVFCAENEMECYNFFYAKEEFLPNLDSYFFDLYHMTGEGADIVSRAFARLINALSAGEDVSSWFFEKDWQYRETITWIVNTWIHPKGDITYKAGCNTGSLVHPQYRFSLLDEAKKEVTLRDWDKDPEIQVELNPGENLRVYAKLTEYPDQEPVWFDYPDDYGYAKEHQHLY